MLGFQGSNGSTNALSAFVFTDFAFSVWMLLQLLNAPQYLYVPLHMEDEEDTEDPVDDIVQNLGCPIHDPYGAMRATLHNF